VSHSRSGAIHTVISVIYLRLIIVVSLMNSVNAPFKFDSIETKYSTNETARVFELESGKMKKN
jgi:hypothetical protein